MDRLKLATVWLGGCSGCHMSFLDMDEFLIDLAEKVTVVYSPIADVKEFPENVDVTLVEGAVASDEHVEMAKTIRRNSKLVVSFGDCAVTGNVTAMRNPLGGADNVLQRAYMEAADQQKQIPMERDIIPVLLDRVRAVHEVIPVDIYLTGCPPSASRIKEAVEQLLDTGEIHLDASNLKFG